MRDYEGQGCFISARPNISIIYGLSIGGDYFFVELKVSHFDKGGFMLCAKHKHDNQNSSNFLYA